LVTLSIGIATQIPGEDVCAEWLLRQADQALYAAKHSGRNQVVSAYNVIATLRRSPEREASAINRRQP
jgi:predicted signal transduction protein with EAL and GGDEF domain